MTAYCMAMLGGCSAGQPVRVLQQGATQITASLGGPVAPSTVPTIAVPYVTAGVMHGVTPDVTLHGNLHALMLAFGTLGIDLGASTRLVAQDGVMPELTVALRGLLFTDFSSMQNVRLYPDASLIASWEVRPKWLPYLGTHVTAQFNGARLYVSPMVGLQAPLSENINAQAEIIWQAANANTSSGVFRGESSVGGKGSLGVFLGIGYML